MMANFGWAKYPMIHRLPALRNDVPITFIYGARSWIDRKSGDCIKDLRENSYVDVHVNYLSQYNECMELMTNWFVIIFLSDSTRSRTSRLRRQQWRVQFFCTKSIRISGLKVNSIQYDVWFPNKGGSYQRTNTCYNMRNNTNRWDSNDFCQP